MMPVARFRAKARKRTYENPAARKYFSARFSGRFAKHAPASCAILHQIAHGHPVGVPRARIAPACERRFPMSHDTTSGDGATPAQSSNNGRAAMSQNVPGCPNGADRHSAPAAQVPAGLTDAQLRAIELLLAGTSPAKVAQACGVDRRTIFRWRHECEPFRAELDRGRRAMWASAVERMRAMVGRSLSILEEELDDEYDRSRVRAASLVLTHSNVRRMMRDDMDDPIE
jgi:hypothetical protein